jgi:hypothetical protein
MDAVGANSARDILRLRLYAASRRPAMMTGISNREYSYS